MSPPKVLCLHGHGQNKLIMAKKSKFLKEYFRDRVEFIYLTAPFELDESHEYSIQFKDYIKENRLENRLHEFEPLKKWFEPNGDNISNFKLLLDYIDDILKTKGPFKGIIGFSEGGMIGSLITTLLEQKTPIFKLNHPKLDFIAIISSLPPAETKLKILFDLPIKTPSFHIYGESDKITTPSNCYRHYQSYKNAELFIHPNGHEIPIELKYQLPILKFIENKINFNINDLNKL